MSGRAWYQTRKKYRGNSRLLRVSAAVDEMLQYHYAEDQRRGATDAISPAFPACNYGKISWSPDYVVPSTYVDIPGHIGWVVPATPYGKTISDDDIPAHLTAVEPEFLDEGWEIFAEFESLNSPTRVYFVQAMLSGLVKIGIATDPNGRLSSLRSGSPEPLELIASVPANKLFEQYLHGVFEPLHSHSEWYHPHWTIYSVAGGFI
jgi:hypothetical protein